MSEFLHHFERLVALAQVGHAGRRVGGGAGRVQLHRVDEAGVLRAADLVRVGVVGQVQRHQRLELHPGRQRGQDAVAVGGGIKRRW
jgi:hypothetical protein